MVNMVKSVYGRKIFFNVFFVFLVTVGCHHQIYAQTSPNQTHVVVAGDTWWNISRRYDITVDELVSCNSMTKNDVLKIGQKLKIPAPSRKSPEARKYDVYTVQKGDTLYHIAKINNTTVAELTALNGISSGNPISIGQKLWIPLTIVDTTTASLPDLPSNDPRNYSQKKGDSNLTWPVKNPTVTYLNGKSGGVQLSAAKNEDVKAVRAGTVTYVGNYRGYGQLVFIQAKSGHIYAYSGLGDIKVRLGDYVVFGDVIGTAGTDSIKGTSQIMFMVYQRNGPLDPAKAPRG